jgi:hypothetical protein
MTIRRERDWLILSSGRALNIYQGGPWLNDDDQIVVPEGIEAVHRPCEGGLFEDGLSADPVMFHLMPEEGGLTDKERMEVAEYMVKRWWNVGKLSYEKHSPKMED